MKARRKYKPRNVNLEPRTLLVRNAKGKLIARIIHAGDSLHTVPCPNKISNWMRQNLRQVTRRSQVAFPVRRQIAGDVMKENGISIRRK